MSLNTSRIPHMRILSGWVRLFVFLLYSTASIQEQAL